MPRVLNRDMNKDKRKALIEDLTEQFKACTTADDYVRLATSMVDLKSQGRTDRWKAACTNAGRRIIARLDTSGRVTDTHARSYVSVGLEALTLANK